VPHIIIEEKKIKLDQIRHYYLR